MKKTILTLAAWLIAGTLLGDEVPWTYSVPEASAQAGRENKLVLLDFTGSDWCGWCKKLDAETFSTPAFIDYASKNLVLVQLDYPNAKPQSDALKEANKALKEKYAINGFPTVIVLKPDGTVLWKQVGYLAGGAAAMISKLNEFRTGSAQTAAAPSAPAPSAVARTIIWPAPPPHKAGDEPRLQGILYSTSHATVVLDGQICEEGDSVEGMRVIKIARDKVTVEWQGQTKYLRMN